MSRPRPLLPRRAVCVAVLGLLLIAATTTTCTMDRLLVFAPTTTDRYELPGNHIPPSLTDEVPITTSDQVTIYALFARQEKPEAHATIYYFHGQTVNLDGCWDLIMRLWDAGYNVFGLDYRGFGKSGGEPSEEGLYLDALAGLDSLLARGDIDRGRIVVWGYSLGTGVAAYVAVERPQAALVLEAAYTSITEMVEGSAPLEVPADWLVESRFNTLGRIGRLTSPLVVGHGTEDTRIPFWMGEAVYQAAPEPKRFVRVEGGGHSDVLATAADEIFAALAELDPTAAP